MSMKVFREGRTRRALATAFAGLLASGTFAIGDASAESIVEAVEAALDYHPQVRRDQALSVAAEHAVEEAYSDFLPDLDLDASSGYEATNSPTTRGAGRGTVDMIRSEASIRLTQLIFDFYGTSNRVAAAESELEASNADLQATNEGVARQATRLFLDTLSARERVALAEQNLTDLSTILDLIRGRAEAGRAAEADLDQAISRVALAKADLASRRGQQREVASRFVENVGHVPGDLERPTAPDYPQANDLDAALAVAMDQNPAAHSTTARWDAREAEVEVARSAYFPRIDFEASGRVGENIDGIRGGDSDIRFLVRLTWNLFNGFGDVAETRRASHEASAASYTDADTRRAIREAVRIAFRNLQTAQDRLPQLVADADASTRTFEAYRQQYDVGQRSLLDLLDARDEMFTAQEAEVRGQYDVLQAHYELLFSMGILLDQLGVVVFQDREQYREHRQSDEMTEAKAGDEAGQKTTGLSVAEADWSGEVAVPGGLEFGSWLGSNEKAAVAAPQSTPPASPKASTERLGDRQSFRREFVGIEVETVPAMTSLPEREVAVLPVGGSVVAPAEAQHRPEENEDTVFGSWALPLEAILEPGDGSAGQVGAAAEAAEAQASFDLLGVMEELAALPSGGDVEPVSFDRTTR